MSVDQPVGGSSVGRQAASVHNQLWEPAVLEQWAAAVRTPSMQWAHMDCSGAHTLGREFVRQVIKEAIAKACATIAEGPAGPKQHDGVGFAGTTPAPAGGAVGSLAEAPGLTAMA